MDFPGDPGVQKLPFNEGNMGSISGWRTKIPHATGQLSLRAATTDPACSKYRARAATKT